MHEERLVGGAQYNGVVIPRKESYTYANTPILKESGVSYYNKTKKMCFSHFGDKVDHNLQVFLLVSAEHPGHYWTSRFCLLE